MKTEQEEREHCRDVAFRFFHPEYPETRRGWTGLMELLERERAAAREEALEEAASAAEDSPLPLDGRPYSRRHVASPLRDGETGQARAQRRLRSHV